jgi:hypothetical protein
MLPRMDRTQNELLQDTWDQVSALRRFGSMYDEGDRWAAKFLATAVSTLVRDGRRNTHPLLEQIGVRAEMQFLSTARPLALNVKPDTPLLLIRSGPDGFSLVPKKDVPVLVPESHWLPFPDWWAEPIFGDAKGQRLTREELVKSIRDQDGGAHVDPVLTDAAYKLLKAGEVGVQLTSQGRQVPIEGAQLASMRQIAWELEHSLGPHLGPSPAPRPISL